MLEWTLDVALGVGVVWLAWKALSGADLFRSVVLYIVFGLLLALAWVRLEAPDIALAEAAIGAGLTGALLLDAASQLSGRSGAPSESSESVGIGDVHPPERIDRARRSGIVEALASVSVLVLGGVLAIAMVAFSEAAGGLTGLVDQELHRSGVTHGVTAVLLNFRAFDTLLEVSVLLAAVLAMLVVRRTSHLGDVSPPTAPAPIVRIAAGILIPLMILMAGYLLWLGTHAPGGAFQAGAVLASAGVLLFLAGHRSIDGLRAGFLAATLAVGFAGFLAVALATVIAGLRLLELSPALAGQVILLIEAMLAISIGGTLAALFLGARPSANGEISREVGVSRSGPG